jgi:hypothetical protein
MVVDTDLFEPFSIQSGRGATSREGAGEASGADFSERIGDEVLYAWLYPNVMFNRYGSTARAFSSTTTSSTQNAPTPSSSSAASLRATSSSWRTWRSASRCKRGLGSRAFDRGRHSVKREKAALHFHQLLAPDLRSGI